MQSDTNDEDDAAREARPRTRRETPARVRPLDRNALAQLERARSSARRLARGAERSADEIAGFVDQKVRAAQRARRLLDIPPLAALYGDALVSALGWQWRVWDRGKTRALGVVAPDDTHIVLPGRLIAAQLGPGAAVTILLLFQSLERRELPQSAPGGLMLLG